MIPTDESISTQFSSFFSTFWIKEIDQILRHCYLADYEASDEQKNRENLDDKISQRKINDIFPNFEI